MRLDTETIPYQSTYFLDYWPFIMPLVNLLATDQRFHNVLKQSHPCEHGRDDSCRNGRNVVRHHTRWRICGLIMDLLVQ